MNIAGQANIPVEIHLLGSEVYADTFNEVDVDLIVSGEAGQRTVPAFWAGGPAFKARFAAPEVGRYQFESRCSNPDDSGLHGVSGEIEIAPYPGANTLYRRGRLKVSDDRRTLEHSDGTPFFWLGDTWLIVEKV